MRFAGLAIVLAAIPASASADTCPAPDDAPGVASIDAERRYAYLERSLERAAEQSGKWSGFWRAGFQTTAVVQLTLSTIAEKRADRIDLAAGGIKSTVGFAFAAIFRLPAEAHDGPWGDRPWREGPLCTRVALAEAQLARDAKIERRGRSIGMQALGIGFNVAVGVITYVMHRRLWSVVLGMVTGGIVGEIRVLTQPTDASRALDAYRAGMLSSPTASVTPLLLPRTGGAEVGVAVSF